MKISEIRRVLVSQSYKAKALSTKAAVAKDSFSKEKWEVTAKLNRDYISYIDYITNNVTYYRTHKESIAQKLYWVLSHIEKCDNLIKEAKQNI